METAPFYITLPSNASKHMFPDNQISNYTVNLAKPVDLKGSLDVALKEIQYPRTWNTFTKHKAKFNIKHEQDPVSIHVGFPHGYYPSVTSVVDAISSIEKYANINLVSDKPTQTSIENSFFMEVSPLATLTPLAPIEFFVSGSTDMYLDLNNTLLHLVCKITKANGANIDDEAKVAPIANPIATMFNQVDINMGDLLITQSDNMYAYRAYIESILNNSREALNTQFSPGLFYKDTHAHFKDRALDGGNDGFKKRDSFAAGSRQFDLLGRVHSDLFFQDRLLVNGIDLKIKLNCNKGVFHLISGDAEQYKLVILSANLFVKRVKRSPSVRLAHPEALQLSNAKYAIERVALKIFSIPAGTRLTQQQNLFMGQLPKLIIIGAVIPAKPFIPSFGTSNLVRENLGQVSITGKHLRDPGVVVSREGYGTSYTLFAFDLTPDMEDGDHYNLIKNGNLKAEIRFTQALATNVNMIVFSVFDNVIQVNHACQIMFHYH
ncbi:uncharacterized protein F54H12.2-like [Pleurodeles waltl]|uniref:uncharacterized protein F54H12.2-like n=1 Tax=Pleurodeles waltl TaxID=8319 RepID=UPI00370937E0